MDQPLFPLLINIAASIFFGIVSTYIYDSLRDRGVIPNRPTLKAVIIIMLASLLFVILTMLGSQLLDRMIMILIQQIPIYLWLLLVFILLSFLIGFSLGQNKSKRLLKQLHKRNIQLDDCKKMVEQQIQISREMQPSDIINPE